MTFIQRLMWDGGCLSAWTKEDVAFSWRTEVFRSRASGRSLSSASHWYPFLETGSGSWSEGLHRTKYDFGDIQ